MISALLQQAITAHRSEDLATASTLYLRILDIEPDCAPALTNLGSILRQQGHLDEAIDLLTRAVSAPQSNEHAAYNLGNALRSAGRYRDAAQAFRTTILRKPNWALAHCNLGVVLADAGDSDAAEQAFRDALYIEPVHEMTRQNLAALLSAKLMRLQYVPGDEVVLTQCAREYGALCPPEEPIPVRARSAAEPLRIGFLSPDLCDHPVGLFLLPVLEHLDKRMFQPILYSTGGREDHTRGLLKKYALWLDVGHLDDAALLHNLRNHQLDILIDLSGHTAGHRLPVFARRAAPIQISWLGYFATTGVPAMDYVLMDHLHVPDGGEQHFTEHVLYLPHSRFCYQPVSFAPEVSPAPCLSRGYVTFGSFNNSAKYHEDVFDLWARILANTPGSRLVLKWRTHQENIYDIFAQRGISPDRLELRPFSYHADLLKEYADIDIALDPFPFTGGLTSCEALWMGVPVVTWPQSRTVSRQTYAFLNQIGLPELSAKDGEEYVRSACDLAQDPERLAEFRDTLREKMHVSPLMDVTRFTRQLEDTLLALYHRI